LVKKGSSFAKIGAIILAVVMGLGLMGLGVSYWSDTVNIDATVEMGEALFELTATDNSTSPSGGSVTCQVVNDALEVTVVDASTAYDYYGHFTIENTGDIPLKMAVYESTVPEGVVAQIVDMSGDGIIDPTETEDGKVHVYLEDDTQLGQTFTVITNAVMWNQ